MKKRRLWIIPLVLIVLAAAGGGYAWWRARAARAAVTTDTGQSMHTALARRGSLEILTTAAGTVVASLERTLGYETPAELLELYVALGQQVAAGDPLARVDDLALRQAAATAEAAATRAEVALREATESLASLAGEPDEAAVLNARATLAAATERLAELASQPTPAELAAAEAAAIAARDAYQALVAGPTADELQEAQWSLERARNSLWSAQMSRDAAAAGRGYDQAQVGVLNGEIAVAQAALALARLQAPAGEVELAQARAAQLKAEEDLAAVRAGASEADLAAARAAVIVAQEALDDLLDGASETERAAAEIAVRQAELNLEQARLDVETAQRELAAATLAAPIAGTVMSIGAGVGEKAGASLITIADLTRPVLEVYIDESDMTNMKVGYAASLEFDALPGELYTGVVTAVDPGLTSAMGMTTVRGEVTLDVDALPEGTTLPTGMSATVDIIAGSAENAVLVPVEALRELSEGEYAVFVVTDGEPALRLVEVGLIDVTYAEIVSGLEVGESVTTGLVEVQ